MCEVICMHLMSVLEQACCCCITAPSHRKYHRVCPLAAFFHLHLFLLIVELLGWALHICIWLSCYDLFCPFLLCIFFCFFDLTFRCIPFISSLSIPFFLLLSGFLFCLSSLTVSIIFTSFFTGISNKLDKPC